MPSNATSTMKVKVPPKGQGQKKRKNASRAKHRAKFIGQNLQAKNYRAKIEGKLQGKGKGKTTNYYFP